jgi:hypothetical protein
MKHYNFYNEEEFRAFLTIDECYYTLKSLLNLLSYPKVHCNAIAVSRIKRYCMVKLECIVEAKRLLCLDTYYEDRLVAELEYLH